MNINTLDLNLLRVLDALLHDGSTVKAGARLGLSQPAVSAALGRLRHALGDELFLRRGQGLEPTDFARALSLPLRAALDGLETLLSSPAPFDPALANDTFKLSGSDFFAEMLMPALADRLSRQAPGMRVQLVDLVPENYAATLQRHEVDIALIPLTTLPDWVDHRPVFRSSFVVIARQDHPRLARAGVLPGMVIPIDLFCDLGHVLFSPEGRFKALGDAALARVGRERRVVMTLPVFSGIARAVSTSDLISILPGQLSDRVAPGLSLSLYQAPVAIPQALMTMIWHRRASATPAHRWMRDLIAEILLPLNANHEPLPSDATAPN